MFIWNSLSVEILHGLYVEINSVFTYNMCLFEVDREVLPEIMGE